MRMRLIVRAYGLCLAVLPAVGCGQADRQAAGAAAGGDVRPVDGGGQGGAGEGGAGGAEPLVCDEPRPGPSPLLRLDTFQLGNTLRELFQHAPRVAQYAESAVHLLPSEVDLFSSGLASAAQEASTVGVERYHQLAHDLALRLSEDAEQLHAFIECDPSPEDALPCRDRFLETFLQRGYRRPVSEEELQEMQAVFAKGQELGGDFASGVRAVVEVVLQGPDFLYLIERGTGDARGDAVTLTGYETASRVAYLLTGSAPDAELRASAQSGPLTAQDVTSWTISCGSTVRVATQRSLRAIRWRLPR